MSKDALTAVGGGAISALLYLSAHLGSPVAFILTYFTLAPLFLVGLGLGLAALILAVAAAVVLVAIGAGFNSGALFALVYAVPAALMVRLALLSRETPDGGTEWYPPGLLICWLTGYGAAVFVLSAILTSGSQDGLEGMVNSVVPEVLEGFTADASGSEPTALARILTAFFPALVIATWLITVAVNATLAQKLLTRFGRNLRPSPQFAAFDVPGWMAVAVVIAVLLWRLTGPGTPAFIGRNLAWVFLVPYFLMGLAVVHTLSRRWSARTLVLVTFYLILILVGWPALAVAALGFIEQWAGLRRRFAGPGDGQEEER